MERKCAARLLDECHGDEAENRREVLVVDDDSMMRKLTGAMVGHVLPHLQVVEMSCPIDAIEHLRGPGAERTALVLTDSQMPKMVGIDLAKVVRGHEVEGLDVTASDIYNIQSGARISARSIAGGVVFGVSISQRESRRLARVPIVLNTANPSFFDPTHADGKEVYDLIRRRIIGHALQKPFGIEQLTVAIQKASKNILACDG